MNPKIFELLNSTDIEERLRGVKALAQTEDQKAIPILAKIYREDPDPQVRELAVKAGQHIKKRIHQAQWVSQNDDAAVYVDVSPDDEREARRSLNKAIQEDMIGNTDESRRQLQAAFNHNPNLQHDREGRRAASQLLKISEQEAVERLLNNEYQ